MNYKISFYLSKVAKTELVEGNGWQEEIDASEAQNDVFKVEWQDEFWFRDDEEREESQGIEQLKSCACAHGADGQTSLRVPFGVVVCGDEQNEDNGRQSQRELEQLRAEHLLGLQQIDQFWLEDVGHLGDQHWRIAEPWDIAERQEPQNTALVNYLRVLQKYDERDEKLLAD